MLLVFPYTMQVFLHESKQVVDRGVSSHRYAFSNLRVECICPSVVSRGEEEVRT